MMWEKPRQIRLMFSLLFFGLILLVVLVLPGGISRGQDVTHTPTEPIPTETPLPSATPEPTVTATFTATTTSTASPTPTYTATASPTATLTATITPSLTPTETASPQMTASSTPIDTSSPTATAPPLMTATVPPLPTETLIATSTVSPTATMLPADPVVLLDENAETDTAQWVSDGTWQRSSAETAHHGDWVFSDSPSMLYAANTVSALSLAQPLNLPPNARIQLQYWQRLDLGVGDSVQVQVSSDNLNWTTVASETAVRNLVWTVRTVYLDDYAGQALWLRFVLSTDADPQTVGDGWWLDDITVRSEPLPVTPRNGLPVTGSDDPALWLAEGNWMPITPGYESDLAWGASSQPETAVALTLNADISLTFSTAPELRFWHWLDLAEDGTSGQVQLSTDGGQTWTSLMSYGATDTTPNWTDQSISLAMFAGQTVRVRFLLTSSEDNTNNSRWAVDAIALQPTTTVLPTLTPTPTPSVTVIASPTPTSETDDWTLYADTDPGLAYNGDWQTFAVAAASGGTLTASADPGATLTTQFYGTGVRLWYANGPEGQDFQVQVDDETSLLGNSYALDYSYGHTLVIEDLLEGEHVLTVTNGPGAIWVEAVEVQGELLAASLSPATPTPTMTAAPADEANWTTYADTEPLLIYSNGDWQTFEVTAANGGTLTGSADPGAILTTYFYGTGVRLLFASGPEGQAFQMQVDDGTSQSGDSYALNYSYGNMLVIEDLPEGEHVLTVTNGLGAIWVEAIEIRGELRSVSASPATPTPTSTTTPTGEAAGTNWTLYADTDPLLVYSAGDWQTFAVSEAIGGTLTETANLGARLIAHFEGTGVRVIHSKGPEGRTFQLELDGEIVEIGDGYHETYSYGHILTIENLNDNLHTLTVINGEGTIWVESLEVEGLLNPDSVVSADFSLAAASTPEAGFYLSQESKSLTFSSSTSTCWTYDSIEWRDQIASETPIIGTCYDVTQTGGTQVAARMGSSHDGYTSPWIGFWGDTSPSGPAAYRACIAGYYAGLSRTDICNQVCPGALVAGGSFPDVVDGDYVATWKKGCSVEGTVTIDNMRLIYYGVPPVEMQIEKTIDDPEPAIGIPAKFTITVTNVSEEAKQNIEVIDSLPEGLVLPDDSNLTLNENNEIVWMIDSLAAGQSIDLSFEAIPTDDLIDQEVTNTARVSSVNEEPISDVEATVTFNPVCKGQPNGDTLNVRETPSLQGTEVHQLAAEDTATIIGITLTSADSNEWWYRIDFSIDGTSESGWVKANLLDNTGSCPTPILDHSAERVLKPNQQAHEHLAYLATNEEVLTIDQITSKTNGDSLSDLPTLAPLTPLVVKGIHPNRQYVQVNYLDGSGDNSWIHVRDYNSTTYRDLIITLFEIKEINGEDVVVMPPEYIQDNSWKTRLVNDRPSLEVLVLGENDLPTCGPNQFFNCKPSSVEQQGCTEIFGCGSNNRSAFVLNMFKDREDGCTDLGCGSCAGWSSSPANTWHCGIDLVTQEDATLGNSEARDVYTVHGGLYYFYADSTFAIRDRDENDVGIVREYQYVHLIPTDIFTSKRGEYIASGIRLGVYGNVGDVGPYALHIHYVEKQLKAPILDEETYTYKEGFLEDIEYIDSTENRQYEVPDGFAGNPPRYIPICHPLTTFPGSISNAVGDTISFQNRANYEGSWGSCKPTTAIRTCKEWDGDTVLYVWLPATFTGINLPPQAELNESGELQGEILQAASSGSPYQTRIEATAQCHEGTRTGWIEFEWEISQ